MSELGPDDLAGFAEDLFQIDREIISNAFTSDETERVLYALCDDIGARFAGTEGEVAAAEFMAATFRQYGLDKVEIEEFDFLAWRRGNPARLQTIGAANRSIPCISLPCGTATPDGGIAGELVDIGPGSADGIKRAADRIRGRVVLTEASAAHRSEIYRRVVKAGAKAFILSGSTPGMMLPTGCVCFGTAGTIPAIGIAYESGLLIKRLSKQEGLKARVCSFDRFEPGVSRNVVGEITGRSRPEEIALIGGHMDSHDVAPGAVDNASGTTCVVETSRLLSRCKESLARSVRFVAFGAEEVGLLGSYAYTSAHAAEMSRIRLMLNLDCLVMSRPKGFVSHFLPDAALYIDGLRRRFLRSWRRRASGKRSHTRDLNRTSEQILRTCT